MTVVTRFWWIRHAPVTADGGRIYGQSDIVADCSDRESFAALAPRLPRDALWVASHLRRTHQTAAALAEAGAIVPELIVEIDLAEQSFGEWQGQPRAEIFARHSEWHQFWHAPARFRPPGGESFADLVARAAPVITNLAASHGGRNIVAIAHGGTIRAALAHALGLDPDIAVAFVIDNLSVTRLDHIAEPGEGREAWRVVAVNESAHLRDG